MKLPIIVLITLCMGGSHPLFVSSSISWEDLYSYHIFCVHFLSLDDNLCPYHIFLWNETNWWLA